jgi:hypothetical protein
MVPSPNQVFTVRETHGRAERAGNRLIAHSQEVGWRSLYGAILEEVPFSATEPAIRHPFLIYHLSRPTEVSRKIEGARKEKALLGPRRICLTPKPSVELVRAAGRSFAGDVPAASAVPVSNSARCPVPNEGIPETNTNWIWWELKTFIYRT